LPLARLGLDEAVVRELLGSATVEERRRMRRRSSRIQALRVAAAQTAVAALLAIGLVATDSPGDRTRYARTGGIHTYR
jgi:hypothetical protein